MSLVIQRKVAFWLTTVCVLAASSAFGLISGGTTSLFTYAGGTEHIQYGCEGQLEVASSSMIFRCPEGSLTIPYHTITHMEYRPKLSRAVRGMKLGWVAKPDGSGRKQNLFFTVLYQENHRTHAIVLKVSPDEMRPYLAVLELHTGMRIHVWDYRGFD